MERHVRLVSRTPLPRGEGLDRAGSAGVTVIRGGAKVLPFPSRARPKDTIPARVRRIVTERDMGLCVYTGRPAEHIHHRRLLGMGGSSDAHTACPCNLISMTFDAHEFMHKNRFIALAEGLIVPAATPAPWLLPVLVHGLEDGSGVRAWPTCDGRWIDYEPEGDGAA
jgi:hypothetical protein